MTPGHTFQFLSWNRNVNLQLSSIQEQHVAFTDPVLEGPAHLVQPSSVRLSSVSRGFSPRRQPEEILCTPCSLWLQLASLVACDLHCTSVGPHWPIAPVVFQTPELNGFNPWCYLKGKVIWGAEYTWVPPSTAALWVISGSPLRESKSGFFFSLNAFNTTVQLG